MKLTILFVVLFPYYTLLYSMNLSLAPLIALPNDLNKNIIRTTIEQAPTSGQQIALSLVCKSWQEFCKNDAYILECLLQTKQLNEKIINHLLNSFYRCIYQIPSESELLEIISYRFFDVRHQLKNNSLLKYAITNSHYKVFEKLLQSPYLIIRPIILEEILKKPDPTFISLLKKYSFNFGRYHVVYTEHKSKFIDVWIPILLFKVTYAEKKYSSRKNEKRFLYFIKKATAYKKRAQGLETFQMMLLTYKKKPNQQRSSFFL